MKVSIIMPIRFRTDLARVALDSIKNYTQENVELVLVHEGTDEDVKPLAERYGAKYVHNSKAKGYPGAINSGYAEVSEDCDYVLLLNSDVVATPGWLTELLKAFRACDGVGIACPTYTEAIGIQSVDKNDEHREPYTDMSWDMLKGVCVLMPREVCRSLVNEYGYLLDERFGMGGGDDNDLAFRVKKMGKNIVCARKAYIYHYNSASFREIMKKSEAPANAASKFSQFKQKWGGELNMKPSVLIVVPTVSGRVHQQLVRVLVPWMQDQEIRVEVNFIEGMVPLDSARNMAVRQFLKSNHDYLCFIDDDIVPPINALRALVAADKDVVAPLCFTLNVNDDGVSAPMPVAFRNGGADNGPKVYVGDGLEEVDIVTGGMHLVKRKVFETVKRPYAFTYTDDGVTVHTEDFYFSKKCKEHGFTLWTDFRLMCKHYRGAEIAEINRLLLTEMRKFQK